MTRGASPMHQRPYRADRIAAQVELRQAAIRPERVGDGSGTRVADVVRLVTDLVTDLVGVRRWHSEKTPLSRKLARLASLEPLALNSHCDSAIARALEPTG